VLNDIVKRHQFMIGLKVFRPPDNAEHKSHTPDIGFHNKRVGVTLCHQPLYTGESLSGSYKSGLGIRPGWEVVINGHLGHPFKSAESEFRIGRCEEPERPGPQAVPGPYGHDRDVFYTPVPAFPVTYFVEDVVQLHKLFGNPNIQPITKIRLEGGLANL